MPTLTQHCEASLRALADHHLRRTLHDTLRAEDSATVVLREGREFINFASNDYLGLATHPAVIAAGAKPWPNTAQGQGPSRLVTGNHPLYAPLEAKLAAMKNTEAALVFGSGYLTNLGVIPALVGKGDVIFADKLVHACIIDAAQLSGARLIRFRHNDMAHLEQVLKGYREESPNALIVTDHIFSMDGDIAPLEHIAALGEKYDAWTMADDAHGLGIIEPTAKLDIWMGTLSKAAGSYGGYVCGSQALINYLTSAARSFIFSTGLPPSICASALAALEVMAAEPERGSLAVALAQRVTSALGLPRAQSAIVPIILGESETALAAMEKLKARFILAVAIRPPTVAPGTARLRLAFTCEHTGEQVDILINALKECVAC